MGKLEGQTTTRMRQLAKRCGLLSPDTAQRLQIATADQRDLWTDRTLDAPRLQPCLACTEPTTQANPTAHAHL